MDLSETTNLAVTHEPAVLDEASELLLQGASRLERLGWCQNSVGGLFDGPTCMVGSLIVRDPSAAFMKAWRRLDMSVEGGSSTAWNDKPGRTKEEVVAKLRAVALYG